MIVEPATTELFVMTVELVMAVSSQSMTSLEETLWPFMFLTSSASLATLDAVCAVAEIGGFH